MWSIFCEKSRRCVSSECLLANVNILQQPVLYIKTWHHFRIWDLHVFDPIVAGLFWSFNFKLALLIKPGSKYLYLKGASQAFLDFFLPVFTAVYYFLNIIHFNK